MTAHPKRRRPARMGVREPSVIRLPQHLAWLRGFPCMVPGCDGTPIEAAHVRSGTDGALSKKPSDCYAVPLCSECHREQHDRGESAFERKHNIDMRAYADRLWAMSPHGAKWRRENGQ